MCINEKKFRKLLKENPFEEVIAGLLKERKTNEKKQFKHEIKGYTSPKSEYYYTWLTWKRMLERCSNKIHKDYSNYGGRGIKVCSPWKKSFAIFLKDMGKKPVGLSLDRIDVNGNYNPEKRALPFFLSGRSEGECCRQAQISRETYYQWLKEPAFRSALSHMRNAIVEDAVENLKVQSTRAVDTLVKLLEIDNPVLQRHVANNILSHVARFKELQEIETRLAALEAK